MAKSKRDIGGKQALMQALEFVGWPYSGDKNKVCAARSLFIVLWLHDMNWHYEAHLLKEKMSANRSAAKTFRQLRRNEKEMLVLDYSARLLHYIYGWGLSSEEWHSTMGPDLVEELWGMVNNQS